MTGSLKSPANEHRGDVGKGEHVKKDFGEGYGSYCQPYSEGETHWEVFEKVPSTSCRKRLGLKGGKLKFEKLGAPSGLREEAY